MPRRFKCPHGHRYTEGNTLWVKNSRGYRVRACRTCKNTQARARYRANRDRDLARMNSAHRRWLAKQPTLAADDPKHGTVAGYNNHRCRCDECRGAIRTYHQQRKAELRRRAEVAELAAIPERRGEASWSLDSMAAARGWDRLTTGTEWDDPVADLVLERTG